jgi:hypothetical protein
MDGEGPLLVCVAVNDGAARVGVGTEGIGAGLARLLRRFRFFLFEGGGA